MRNLDALTPREHEALELMALGLNHKDVADRMGIEYATAREYSMNVYEKMQVRNRTEAVVKALETGMVKGRETST